MCVPGLIAGTLAGLGLLDCAAEEPIMPSSAHAIVIIALARNRRRSCLISSTIFLPPMVKKSPRPSPTRRSVATAIQFLAPFGQRFEEANAWRQPVEVFRMTLDSESFIRSPNQRVSDRVVQHEFYGDEHQRHHCQAGRKPNLASFLGCHLQARAMGHAVAADAPLTLE